MHLKHKQYGFVQVIEVNEDHIVWHGGEFDRSIPPNKLFNNSPIEDFDMDSEFEAPEFVEHRKVFAADHEIWLRFSEDRQAGLFQNWWQQEGMSKFAQYALDNPPEVPF